MLKYFQYSVNTQIRSAYTVTRIEIKNGALEMQFVCTFLHKCLMPAENLNL